MEKEVESRAAGAGPQRRMPTGAEPVPGGVHFRVWAPDRRRVDVAVVGQSGAHPLAREPSGYFSGLVTGLSAGARYRYRLDGADAFPDPTSRFQPDGPHGPSEVIDPGVFAWTDQLWRGVGRHGQVLYELHVGAFTPEGTWAAATRELPALAALGVTLIEVMPVAEFPGRFGWGYDGVDLFAPTHLYGRPDDFRAFVDRAHGLDVGVILDVVYNHFGPDGDYRVQFARAHVSARHQTPWGPAPNYDGPDAAPVREAVLANAGYWIREFHLDGLRLDATHAVFDDSPVHILTEVGDAVRAAGRDRGTLVFAEDEPARTHLALPRDAGGLGLDGIWNDDFHHSARVAATGRREGYYRRVHGLADELVAATRGPLPAPDVLDPAQVVVFLQNHDQIANSARGLRLHALTSPGRWRALTALLLLGPETPLLFMGQEFAASSPFLFFADHGAPLAALVRQGRVGHLSQFESVADPAMLALLPDPAEPETFARSRIAPAERDAHPEAVALHRDLIALRRTDPAFAAQQPAPGRAFGPSALALRFARADGLDRLLLVNLGADLTPEADRLLSPPAGTAWTLLWSSEDPRYGGSGTPASVRTGALMSAESAVVLAAVPGP